MNLKNSETIKNLARAFAGECMARTRYEFMEYGARNEGHTTLADKIDEIAYHEFNHARMLYTFIQTADKGELCNIEVQAGYPFKEKWNLLDNLKFASEDEANEAERIYPEFANVAEREGFPDIAGLFRNLIEVEKSHKAFFSEAYQQMKKSQLYKKTKPVAWKCMGCGYQQTSKEAYTDCPLCHAKQGSALLHFTPYVTKSAAQQIAKTAQKATANKASATTKAKKAAAASPKNSAAQKKAVAKATGSASTKSAAKMATAKPQSAKKSSTTAKTTAPKKPAASRKQKSASSSL